MIDNTPSRLVFIRVCIFALRAITPLSIFNVSFCIAEPPHTGFRRFLLAWSVIETGFWLIGYLPRKRSLQAAASHPFPLDKEQRQELFWKCWDKVPYPEYYLSRWFLGARADEIRRDNVREFYEWAFFNRSTEDEEQRQKRRLEDPQQQREEDQELDSYVDGVQTLLGRTLAPGRGNAKSLRLTLDRVNIYHRPVVWYLIVMLVDSLTAAQLRYHGFLLYRTHLRDSLTIVPPRLASFCTRQISPASSLSYWYRAHTSKSRLPVLFIHGIGIGLHPYTSFLTEINKPMSLLADDGDIGVLAVEFMPISFRITDSIPAADEICRQLTTILNRHDIDKCVLMCHSYGSVVTTHLLKNADTAARIGPVVYVDPVTFLLHLPDVAYNFTARIPKGANEHQLYYFASTDMMVAHTLARNFFWTQNIQWKEDLRGRKVTISLGGRDLIVDTQTVGKYLNNIDLKSEDRSWKDQEWKGSGVETIWWPTLDHAQIFERVDGMKRLLDILRNYTKVRTDENEEDFV